MKQRLWLCLLVVVVGVVIVGGERTKDCFFSPSSVEGWTDVYCDCMQKMEKVNVKVARLTVNQTGCAHEELNVHWPTLEAAVAPQTLVIIGARVNITQGPATAPWTSSITAIQFVNCSFVELPSDAFRGLKTLEEVQVMGGAVGIVRSRAFSNLPSLRVVAIVDASVGILESGSWTDLPELTDLALVHCSIGEVKQEAVNLTRQNRNETEEKCAPGLGSDDSRVLEVLSERGFTGSASNLSLPQFGSQLVLFKNHIEVLAPRAFTGDTFGFLIMGGNEVGHTSELAFDLLLYNHCEISAALLVGNTLSGVSDRALAGLRGRQGVAYRTFLALTNNTFSTVSPMAFTLHPNVELYATGENSFQCRCEAMQWAYSEDKQQEALRQELLKEGLCEDGSKLMESLATCSAINDKHAADTNTTHTHDKGIHDHKINNNDTNTDSSASRTAILLPTTFLTFLIARLMV